MGISQDWTWYISQGTSIPSPEHVSPRAAALGDAFGEAFALAFGAVPPQSTEEDTTTTLTVKGMMVKISENIGNMFGD